MATEDKAESEPKRPHRKKSDSSSTSVETTKSESPRLETMDGADPSELLVEAGEQLSLQQIQAAFFEHFRGPLPHPEHFAAYEEIMPGSAERILALAERQASHRHAMETKAVEAGIRAQDRGQWMAFVLSTIAIGGGVILIGMGQPIEGAATALTALASLVGLFVWSKRRESKNSDEAPRSRTKARQQTQGTPDSGENERS